MVKWLCKTEPDECSIDDFAKAPHKPIVWEGVRNYQARNYLKQMAVGDEVLLYHSSCKLIGVSGIVKVVNAAYPDPAQFDPRAAYYDPGSNPAAPRWQAVDLMLVRKLAELISLDSIKAMAGLDELPLVKRGNRLSVMPVSEQEWKTILQAG